MTDRWTPEQYRERADQHFAEAQRLRGRATAFRDTGHKQVASFETAKTWGFAHSAASLFIIADRYEAEAKAEEDKGLNLDQIANRRAFEAAQAAAVRARGEEARSRADAIQQIRQAAAARKPWWRCW